MGILLYSIIHAFGMLKELYGIFVLIGIIGCVGVAVFSFPKYHIRGFGIYLSAMLVIAVLCGDCESTLIEDTIKCCGLFKALVVLWDKIIRSFGDVFYASFFYIGVCFFLSIFYWILIAIASGYQKKHKILGLGTKWSMAICAFFLLWFSSFIWCSVIAIGFLF